MMDRVRAELTIVNGLIAAGVPASAVLRVDPERMQEGDLSSLPYVHVEPVDSPEAAGVFTGDALVLSCYGASPDEAWSVAVRVAEILDEPLWDSVGGLVDSCDVTGPVRGPSFGAGGDDAVSVYVLHVVAESRS